MQAGLTSAFTQVALDQRKIIDDADVFEQIVASPALGVLNFALLVGVHGIAMVLKAANC